MELKKIMTQGVEVISADATVREAAQKMKSFDIGILPVVEDGQLVGVVTDRDIVLRVIAQGLDPGKTRVHDAMTSSVIYCFEDQDVEEAARTMMDNQIRRLLILNRNKQPIGMVSLGDISVHTQDEKLAGQILRHVSEPAHINR